MNRELFTKSKARMKCLLEVGAPDAVIRNEARRILDTYASTDGDNGKELAIESWQKDETDVLIRELVQEANKV